jgi:dienelactone hydrolase
MCRNFEYSARDRTALALPALRSLLAPILLLGLVATAAAQAPEWTSTRPLPAPDGPHPIATLTFAMPDTVIFPGGTRVARPVVAQVWYPTASDSAGPRARYVPDAMTFEAMVREKYEDLAEAELAPWRDLTLHALAGGRPARAPHRGWSAIVISHGFGVSRVSYAALAEALASEGYVVITLDHPYGGFLVTPDGRVLQPGGDSLRRRLGSAGAPATVDSVLGWDARQWAREAAAAVRHLANGTTGNPELATLSVDTQSVGAMGHSLGGAAALEGCRSDPIFRACADLDGAPVGGVERDGVAKPILVLLSQPGGPNVEPADSAARIRHERFVQMGLERDSTWRAIIARHPDVPAFVEILRGTAHYSFTDAPFLMPSLLRGTGSTLPAGEAQTRIVGMLIESFDHFLRAEPLRALHPGMTTVR